ncbi:MAG: hypothetical protein RL737_1327 [Bacteroidota bacterium]
MIAHPQSGRQDSNLRPPGPKPGAMTGLRYAPNESSSSIFNAHQPLLMFYLFSLTNRSVIIPSNLHVIAVGAGLPSVVFASLRHEPCGFSSLPTSTLLRWERDSNPRYSYPYDSLANCWFQPLTHPTVINGRQK